MTEAPKPAVITFTVPGEPVPWARARGSGANRFTAPIQAAYKRVVSGYAFAAGARVGKGVPKAVPLSLCCRVFLPVPLSWKAWDRAEALAGRIRPTSKPDLDNWLKLPMDAMNGLVWSDDAQVVDFEGSGKWYAAEPRLEITVRLVG